MRRVLPFCVLMLAGCGADSDPNGLTVKDVEAIEAGTAMGATFLGTWVMQLKVTETNCDVIPGIPFLPTTDEAFSEDVVLAQNGGELTRVIDDVGALYLFRGAVEKNGDFAYGISSQLAGGIEFIEVTEGTMKLGANSTAATLTGTSRRRYNGGLFDCKATITATGERTLLGSGGEDPPAGGEDPPAGGEDLPAGGDDSQG